MSLHVLIVTHLPSSYKVNLYDRLADSSDINFSVVYCGISSIIRSDDFMRISIHIKSAYLSFRPFEKRNPVFTSLKLIVLLLNERPRKVFINGWDLPEFFVALAYTLIFRKKLFLQVEGSDPYPSFRPLVASFSDKLTRFYKSVFLVRSARIFFSSSRGKKYYETLLGRELNHGEIINGVGICSLEDRGLLPPAAIPSPLPFACRFIGISRYSYEKNILSVLEAFALRPNYSYAHYGSNLIESRMAAICKPISSNVSLNNAIENHLLPDIFRNVDCLILASNYEAWGLVAEEANLCGVPCILSSASGYGDWSKSVGINIVIDSTDSQAISLVLDQFYLNRHQLISGRSLRDIVLEKNRLQVNMYATAIWSAKCC